MGTKEICYIRKESNSHRISLEHQRGRLSLFSNINMAAGRHVKTLCQLHADGPMAWKGLTSVGEGELLIARKKCLLVGL